MQSTNECRYVFVSVLKPTKHPETSVVPDKRISALFVVKLYVQSRGNREVAFESFLYDE